MANRVYLIAFDEQTPTYLGEAANSIPLLWLALFDIQDLSEEEEYGFVLRTSVKTATDRFLARIPLLMSIFPENAKVYFDQWTSFLKAIQQPTIVAHIEEYAWIFAKKQDFVDWLEITLDFAQDSIQEMIRINSLDVAFTAGLGGYIEEVWENKNDLVMTQQNGTYVIAPKLKRFLVGNATVDQHGLTLCSIDALRPLRLDMSLNDILTKGIYLEHLSRAYQGVQFCNHEGTYLLEKKSDNEKNILSQTRNACEFLFAANSPIPQDFIEKMIQKGNACKLSLPAGPYEIWFDESDGYQRYIFINTAKKSPKRWWWPF